MVSNLESDRADLEDQGKLISSALKLTLIQD